MEVKEDVIARPSGKTGIYGYVEKPDFVIVIPYANGRVHLVEQYRYPVKGRFWEFPQGSWEEKKDAPPEEVAMGELKEETGLIAEKITYLGHQYVGYGFSNQGYHIFLATDLSKGEKDLDAEEEDLISSSFKIADFESMILKGEIKDATTICAYGLAKMKQLL